MSLIGVPEENIGIKNTGQGKIIFEAVAGSISPNIPIDVYDFELRSGTWNQSVGENAAINSLADFNVRNSFSITGGAFKRLTGGNGTVFTPFNPGSGPYNVDDIYAFQGIATIAGNKIFNLIENLDGSGTTNWNNGNGFMPIGTSAAPFGGTVNGATVDGVAIKNANIIGKNYVCAFAGQVKNTNNIT